ncbi:hypothetical protein [Pyrococcus abyssi]|nr:hypothetical protein [Pyrococcus abyssi]
MLNLKPEPMIVKLRKIEIRAEEWEEKNEEKTRVKLITNVRRVQLS